ncbi:hypothetical protein ES703_81836 [subsurface metagenome]
MVSIKLSGNAQIFFASLQYSKLCFISTNNNVTNIKVCFSFDGIGQERTFYSIYFIQNHWIITVCTQKSFSRYHFNKTSERVFYLLNPFVDVCMIKLNTGYNRYIRVVV